MTVAGIRLRGVRRRRDRQAGVREEGRSMDWTTTHVLEGMGQA